MRSRKFPILGPSVPPLLARNAVIQRILPALTKPSPDHLQVVGPRFAGKTVILHELARRMCALGSPYTAVLLWDLGHQTPLTDEQFMQQFARELSGTLAAKHTAYAGHLKSPQGHVYHDVVEVFDALKDEGAKILTILDGFDKLVSRGELTRNLWDQLLDLARKPSLRLVTASRRTLHSLIRDPDALTSDFWGIFEPSPVLVGCFDDEDLIAVLATLPNLRLSAGAQTELWNATNGFPVMMLEVLNVLVDGNSAGKIDPAAMLASCDEAFTLLREKIDSLWMDCPPSCQDLLKHVLENGALSRVGIASADAEPLIERGFVHQVGNRLERPNRLLKKYLDEQPNETSALARLFAASESYQRYFKAVLERRIAQISRMDGTLRRYLESGAKDLPDHPEVFLSHVRGIVDRAFDLIWQAELGGKIIPSGWMSDWKFRGERGIEDWQAKFPQGVQRLRLLNLMTGTERSNRCAKHVTKSTYVLMNSAHAFGDFGQHQEGAPINPGVGYAALHLCIELAAALQRELPTQ